ncbi:MAG: hypothetical protein GX442_03210 [Candidatus Riflebacteria bacterium]|nr:hypothetical protein [Candidatus Riflebacteria bacterium]
MEKGTCILLVVHGSKHPDARSSASRFEAELGAAGLPAPARLCFLRMSEPQLPESMEAAAREGFRRLLVVPLFVFPGQHLVEEIPDLVRAFRAAHPAVHVEVGPALGENRAFVGWLRDWLTERVAAPATREP